MTTAVRLIIHRTVRGIRWILGPAKPDPDSLPHPSPSLSISYTLNDHSRTVYLDTALHNFSSHLRLRRGLYPFLVVWIAANILLIRQQYYISCPPIISCDNSLWDDWPPDTCGINGIDCVNDLVVREYRCMGGCRDVTLGNPRWLGGEEVNSVPLVIGGTNRTYR